MTSKQKQVQSVFAAEDIIGNDAPLLWCVGDKDICEQAVRLGRADRVVEFIRAPDEALRSRELDGDEIDEDPPEHCAGCGCRVVDDDTFIWCCECTEGNQ